MNKWEQAIKDCLQSPNLFSPPAELDFAINTNVSHGTFSKAVKKIFPNLSEKVEAHFDKEQQVVYEDDENGKTVTTIL